VKLHEKVRWTFSLHAWQRKTPKGVLSSHGHITADCKTFGRHKKSKKQEACFLENIGLS